MNEEEFLKLKKEIISRLSKELPEHLYYHSLEHTLRVLEKAALIAKHERIDDKDFRLLQLAALFHDIGFVKSSENHEEIGCSVAKVYLANYDLKNKEIDKICGMIMATKIPQQPTNLLEEILADADLEYLGTNDFEPISDHLFKELQHKTPELTKEKWDEIQVKFFQEHNYFTSYAKEFLKNKKSENLKKLINKS